MAAATVAGSAVADSGAINLVRDMVEAMKLNGCSQLQVESMKYMVGGPQLWCAGVLERPFKPFLGMWRMEGDIFLGGLNLLVPMWCVA